MRQRRRVQPGAGAAGEDDALASGVGHAAVLRGRALRSACAPRRSASAGSARPKACAQLRRVEARIARPRRGVRVGRCSGSASIASGATLSGCAALRGRIRSRAAHSRASSSRRRRRRGRCPHSSGRRAPRRAGVRGDVGQQVGAGGRADLVVDHRQRVALVRASRSIVLAKLPPRARVDPAGAKDQVPAAARADQLLAFELGAAVDAERRRCVDSSVHGALPLPSKT